MPEPLTHRVLPMAGRDPDEEHRAATTLELLFDLAFVVAFGTAANELAHALAAGARRGRRGGLLLRDVRDLVGVDQLLVVRLGLRHRRLDLPAHHDGADGGRADPRPRPPRHVRLAGGGRPRRQHRDGPRVHRDAGRHDLPVAAGLPRRPRASGRVPDQRRVGARRAGRLDRAAAGPHLGAGDLPVRRGARARGAGRAGARRDAVRRHPRGTRTTSPSATACS